jgi:hypothetical protein
MSSKAFQNADKLNEYAESFFGLSVGGGLPANLTGAGSGGIEVGAGTEQCPRGMALGCDGAANWLAAQVQKNENPTELILYSSSAQGYATSSSGTNQITKVSGSDFQTRWIGNTIYFLRKKFKVASVPSATTLTVTEMDGSAVNFVGSETEAFNYFYTSGSGICNVSGTTVTFVSGDPFVPLFFTDFSFTLNGVTRTVSAFVSPTEYTLSAAPGDATDVPFTWQGNINDQITTLRVQSIQGANEENLNLMSIAGDNFLGRYFTANTGVAGLGKYRPFFVGTGVYTDFSYQHQIGVYPRDFLGSGNQGYVALGGVQGREGMRVYSPNLSSPTANFISTQGAATTVAPSFRAEGSDTNIAFGIDTKGTGEFRITQSFARTIFKAQGAGATVNWLNAVASAAGAPVEFYASGSDTNISVKLTPKGTGTVILSNLPTSSAGLPSGGLWRDAGAGNVVKIVP